MSVSHRAPSSTGTTQLAELLGDPCEAVRRRAFTELLPHLPPIAACAAARFPQALRHDLVDGAAARLWEIVHDGRAVFRSVEGSFEAWFARVVRNGGLSSVRRRRCRRLVEIAEPQDRSRRDDGAADELSTRRDRLRQLLDELRIRLSVRHIDWHGVLLLHLRCISTVRLVRTWRVSPPEGELAALVEDLLPWRSDEAERPLTAATPSLNQLWQALTPLLDEPPHCLNTAMVCSAVGVSRACWHKWVKRATERARERVPSAEWAQCLAPLLGESGGFTPGP
jgi:hypothetical protein